MLYAVINNQTEVITPAGSGTIEIRCADIPLVIGQQYRLSFMFRSTLAQYITIEIYNSGLTTPSLSTTRYVPANTWKGIKDDFTCAVTDDNSILRIHLSNDADHDAYIDKVRIVNLTKELKSYRIMRIQGSLLPGSFIQTLTLREVTASETA